MVLHVQLDSMHRNLENLLCSNGEANKAKFWCGGVLYDVDHACKIWDEMTKGKVHFM